MFRPRQIIRRLTRSNVFTIPNALSLLRLGLIPLLIHLYLVRTNALAACAVLALSALTDVLDGFIARTYHMVSDLGKFLDPLADKLTQCALLFCLSRRHGELLFLLGLFFIKELSMLAFALLTLDLTDRVHSACWHGKVNTAVLEISLVLLLLPGFPVRLLPVLLSVCTASMLLSLLLYTVFFAGALRREDS